MFICGGPSWLVLWVTQSLDVAITVLARSTPAPVSFSKAALKGFQIRGRLSVWFLALTLI